MRANLMNGAAAAALLIAASAFPYATVAQTATAPQTTTQQTTGGAVESTANDAAKSAEEAADEAAKATENAAEKAEESAETAADKAGEMATDAAEATEDAAEEAADTAEKAADKAQEAAEDAADATEEALTPSKDGMPAETAEAEAPPAEMIVAEQGMDDIMSYDVIGASVMNAEGERIGEIDSLVLGENGIVAAVVGVGGFLGMGEKHVGIAWRELMATDDGYAVSATADQLKQAPTFMTQEELVKEAQSKDQQAQSGGTVMPAKPASE